MNTELELATASRETLLAIIVEQRAAIAQLQRRMAALEARLNSRGSPGMPGNKPPSAQRPREEKETRKPRLHGFSRLRMAPTQRVEHGVEACPECGSNLGGGWVQRTWEVIEVPAVPVQVTEHVLVARLCPVWEQRWVPRVGLQDVVIGQRGLGVNPLRHLAG